MKTLDFRGLPGLKSLILKGCKRLKRVDESIACLNELELLDLTDCIKLRGFSCLPASLVSLEMSGCPNLGVAGGLRCLDSTSAPSFLVNLNISHCNLFDSSFPNDWSNLISLERLIIDGNNITCLPKCIQSLPTLLYLQASHCSKIQSIEGLPDSVNALSTGTNKSLKKVQLSQNPAMTMQISECSKLWEVEGFYKWSSIDIVEKKIIEKMGLGSSMELGTLDYSKLKVLYEFGIFSTWVRGNQIPCCSSYTYNKKGPRISFRVSENDSRKITGFNLCLVLLLDVELDIALTIQVYNKTKDLLWDYQFHILDRIGKTEKKGWVSLWKCGHLLDHGDEIYVRILLAYFSVLCMDIEECGINLIYQEDDENIEDRDDDDNDRERKDDNNQVMMSASDGIAWSDRMFTEISDCVHDGMTYKFGGNKSLQCGTGSFDRHSSYAEPREEGAPMKETTSIHVYCQDRLDQDQD